MTHLFPDKHATFAKSFRLAIALVLSLSLPAGAKETCRAAGAFSNARYEGQCNNGLANGTGKLILSNGDRYEGQFSDGFFSGRGNYYFVDGSRYEGGFLGGKWHGDGTIIDSDGRQSKATYSNGTRVTQNTQQSQVATATIPNAGHESLCLSYGLVKGTEAYANCMLKLREQDLAIGRSQDSAATTGAAVGAAAAEQRKREDDARRISEERASAQTEAAANEKKKLVRTCVLAMLSRPGNFTQSAAAANECAADPYAHVRSKGPSYSCNRGTGGSTNCTPY